MQNEILTIWLPVVVNIIAIAISAWISIKNNKSNIRKEIELYNLKLKAEKDLEYRNCIKNIMVYVDEFNSKTRNIHTFDQKTVDALDDIFRNLLRVADEFWSYNKIETDSEYKQINKVCGNYRRFLQTKYPNLQATNKAGQNMFSFAGEFEISQDDIEVLRDLLKKLL